MKKIKILFVFVISVFTFFLTNNVFAEETYDPETKIRALNTIGTSIADDDPDHNLRFIGANPNNYVSFNGQKWRIIGVFDGRLKIIEDSIGKYVWDASNYAGNGGDGINQWGPSGAYSGADIMKLLNPGYENNKDLKCKSIYDDSVFCGNYSSSDYEEVVVNNSLWWTGTSGYCYKNGGNKTVSSCDFTSTGLKSDEARNMIDNATWYLGSTNDILNEDFVGLPYEGIKMNTSDLYNMERSNYTGDQCKYYNGEYHYGDCTDTVDRTVTWRGKVGLIYPSDYFYATTGGKDYTRSKCLEKLDWNGDYLWDCRDNNWLFDYTVSSMWTISPRALYYSSGTVFFIYLGSRLDSAYAHTYTHIRPVVYLKSSIQFTGGDGSIDKPFELKDVPKEETNTSESNGTISTEKQVVKTGNTGISQSSLLIIIGSIMVGTGSIIIIRKRKNN